MPGASNCEGLCVPVCGLSEAGEFAAGRPVEVATVNDNTTHACTVAANPFGAAVSDDISAESDGSRDVAAHAEGVVDDKGNSSIVSDFGDGGDVGKIVLRV